MGPVRLAQAWGHRQAWQRPSRPPTSSPSGAPPSLVPAPVKGITGILSVDFADRETEAQRVPGIHTHPPT